LALFCVVRGFPVLVFLRSVVHSSPLSFPTRRFSDLFVLLVLRSGRASRSLGGAGAVGVARVADALSARVVLGGVVLDRHRANAEDRKSTRLNSSHQIISYPVLCFNKKTHRNSSNWAK